MFADSLQACLGHRLPVPCVTRWNSIFDAVKKLNVALDKKKTELQTLIQSFNANSGSGSTDPRKLQMFTQSDIDLLREYEKVHLPLLVKFTGIDQ